MLGTRAPGATHLALVAMALWRLLDAIDGWRQQSLHGSHDAIDALITSLGLHAIEQASRRWRAVMIDSCAASRGEEERGELAAHLCLFFCFDGVRVVVTCERRVASMYAMDSGSTPPPRRRRDALADV